MKDMITKNKTIDPTTFTFVASDQSIDLEGDRIMYDAWDTSMFEKNPIILYGHNQEQLPVGTGQIIKDDMGKRLLVKIIFAGHQFAQDCKQLVIDGILKSVSVGFMSQLSQTVPQSVDSEGNPSQPYNRIDKALLLEISVVPCPANTMATLIESKKLDGFRAKAFTRERPSMDLTQVNKLMAKILANKKEVQEDLKNCYIPQSLPFSYRQEEPKEKTYHSLGQMTPRYGYGLKDVGCGLKVEDVPIIDLGCGIKACPDENYLEEQKQKELESLRKFGWNG